eukprot:TRINITY_DN11111_c0_g1_i2.p1 TRINITY_DN11111_c0_g1~~TRINITY_DN11111_c0_g1_i2.p1  ORF type:complete len:809 (-),score=292.58 TRINITY_DN11111_c0_g1_i2:541-2967(-)
MCLWQDEGLEKAFDYDRKEAKTHGEASGHKAMFVTGALTPGAKVLIIDDVGTSMATKKDLLDKLEAEGQRLGRPFAVAGVLLAVDREQTQAVYDGKGELTEGVRGPDALAAFVQETGVKVWSLLGIRQMVTFLADAGEPVNLAGDMRPLGPAQVDEVEQYLAVYGREHQALKRAIVSPILSGLVIPGLGQLVNRQVGKGAFLVAAASLLFMATLGFALHKITQAVIALDGYNGPDKFGALRAELVNQGTAWLWVLGGLMVALWAYAVYDAWQGGRARDAQLAQENQHARLDHRRAASAGHGKAGQPSAGRAGALGPARGVLAGAAARAVEPGAERARAVRPPPGGRGAGAGQPEAGALGALGHQPALRLHRLRHQRAARLAAGLAGPTHRTVGAQDMIPPGGTPPGRRPASSGSYKDLEATRLMCPRCKQAQPVRRRLLLVLPTGEKYSYHCAVCGEEVGSKLEKTPMDGVLKPLGQENRVNQLKTRPSRALITGGAGFIGSHLARHLLSLGQRVEVIDDLSTGSIANLEPLRDNPDFSYQIADMRDLPLLAEMVDRAEVIYHLAAAVGVRLIVESPVKTIETNVGCTEAVLKLANKKGRKVIVASTSEVYGKNDQVPFGEDHDLVMGPTSKARWSYACSKAIDEFLALAYAKARRLPVVVVRLFNTVGPGQTGRYGMVLPNFVRQALKGQPITVYGDGTQSRCFSEVGEVTGCLAALSQCPAAVGQVVNVGSTQEVSILGLAEMVKKLTQSDSPIKMIPYEEAYEEGFEDMPRRMPDVNKLRELVGFAPEMDIEQVVRSVIRYYRER